MQKGRTRQKQGQKQNTQRILLRRSNRKNIDNSSSEVKNILSSDNFHDILLEGECKIDTFQPLILSKIGIYLIAPLFTILTGGIGLILMFRIDHLRSKILYKCCSLQNATNILIKGNDGSYEIVDILNSEQLQIIYRKVKYILKDNLFHVRSFDIRNWDGFQDERIVKNGLNMVQYQQRQKKYGKCQHKVQIPTLWEYLGKQLLGIFFILQYIICTIYIIQTFYFFAAIMIIASIVTTIINYYLLRNSLQRIKEIAERTQKVRVIRNTIIVTIDSTDLVPGDIYFPEFTPQGIPCDSILIKGELYLNQASLTGQSAPVSKSVAAHYIDVKRDNCWLNEGSIILQSRGIPMALVVYTGFLTRKGRIIRNIIHKNQPQPEFFKKGLIFLFQILIFCLITFFAMIPKMAQNQISDKLFILRFLDMLSWVFPPTFPIYFNICYSLSLYRLRKNNIYGTQPLKTVISGKVKIMCFDKTGTLTENKMQLASIKLFGQNKSDLKSALEYKKDENDLSMKLFASCHTVRRINQELLGDELDLRMFLYSGFQYIVSNQLETKLLLKKNLVSIQVLHINQFQSKFQSMSVMVKDIRTGVHYIFVKGAPQKIYELSINPDPDLKKTVSELSLAGLRSLAYGYKQIKNIQNFLKISRQQFQSQINLLGIVAFENKLKSDAVDTIRMLKQGRTEVKIITGDNIYIGVETAIRAGIIDKSQKVIVLQGEHQYQSGHAFTGEILENVDGHSKSTHIQLSLQQFESQHLPIVIDNKFFNLNTPLPQTIKVFARISPQNKAKVVKCLKELNNTEWYNRSTYKQCTGKQADKVGMVGDGANDILAIKQADLGIGISQTDSSFAAHFSVTNLSDVQCIIREGKSTIMIIIEIFRYYMIISILKFIAATIAAIDKSNISDNQFTFINYMGNVEIVLLLCLSHPAQKLSSYTPNDNFMSIENHLIMYGHLLIFSIGTLIIYYVTSWSSIFVPNPNKDYNQWVFVCHTNTVIFLSNQLFQLFSAIFIYHSTPWKQRIWKNIPLTLFLIAIIGVSIALFWFTPQLSSFFGLVDISEISWKIFCITIGFVILSWLWSIIIKCLELSQ